MKSIQIGAKGDVRVGLAIATRFGEPWATDSRHFRFLMVNKRLLPQNLLHRFSFSELINQLVEPAYFLHQRIFYFFHTNATHYALDQRTIWVNGWRLRKKGFDIAFQFELLL